LAENAEGERARGGEGERARGGEGEKKKNNKNRNKEKTEKMRSSHPRKTRAQDDAYGIVWDPQSFKKPHNVFLSELYFLSGSRFTSHGSLVLINEIATSLRSSQ
jgi:hypothetical protein